MCIRNVYTYAAIKFRGVSPRALLHNPWRVFIYIRAYTHFLGLCKTSLQQLLNNYQQVE